MFSIIIPTLNRATSLKLTLQSLCSQNFLPSQFEIIVVDNGSTDNTKTETEVAINLFPSHQIRYVYEPEPGSLSGRHRGTLEAQGDILIFVDDDIEADINWLQAIKKSFDDSTVQIVGGRSLPNYEVEPPKWLEWFWSDHPYGKFCGWLSLLDFGNQVREIDANYVWSLNLAIKKSALFELNGFHPDIVPKHLQYFQGDGETGLTQKANQRGYKAIYQPEALVFHFIPKERMTHEYFEKRWFFQGICDSYSLIRKNKALFESNHLIDKLKSLSRQTKLMVKKLISKQSEKELLENRFAQAYQQGYQFHQKAVRDHPQLIDWILKENYWDYKLPKLNISNNSL